MSATEIYNMKVNMGLLDLQKYNSLVKEIENIPQRYIDGLELEKIEVIFGDYLHFIMKKIIIKNL